MRRSLHGNRLFRSLTEPGEIETLLTKLRVRCVAVGLLFLATGCASGQQLQSVPAGEFLRPAVRHDLMYVSNESTGYVSVLTYPDGIPIGAIGGFAEPEGECVDGVGDVFIADRLHHQVQEFAHGRMSPIKTLAYSDSQPFGCSVDPVTGNLAVTNSDWTKKQKSAIAIFRGASGAPQTYTWPNHYALFCGYDNQGNLYVDGIGAGHNLFAFAELAAGGNAIVPVSLNQTIQYPGSVQWDGTYMMVADTNQSVAYRFQFTKSGGVAVGSPTYLDGSYGGLQETWVYHGNITGTDGDVRLWNYPAGGDIVKTYTGFSRPVAAVVSPVR